MSKAMAREMRDLENKLQIRWNCVDYAQRKALVERDPEIRGMMLGFIYGTVEEHIDKTEEEKEAAILQYCNQQRQDGTYATSPFMKAFSELYETEVNVISNNKRFNGVTTYQPLSNPKGNRPIFVAHDPVLDHIQVKNCLTFMLILSF